MSKRKSIWTSIGNLASDSLSTLLYVLIFAGIIAYIVHYIKSFVTHEPVTTTSSPL